MEEIKKETNDFNECIYNFYFNKNIIFTWMKPEDIKYIKTSSSSQSPFYYEKLIQKKSFTNYHFEFLGFSMEKSDDWLGRRTNVVFKLNDTIYIRDMKAFLEIPTTLKHVPYVTHTKNNISYYLNKYNKNLKYINCIYDKIHNKTPLAIQCLSCGYQYESCLQNIKYRNTDCPDCMNNVVLSEDDMLYRITLKLHIQPHIKLLKFNYNNGGNKNAIGTYYCEIHDHTWDSMYFSTVPKDQSCKLCMQFQSKGEIYITEILNSFNVNYKREYKFDDCINQRKLPFDFYLPDYNICIEYDGKQHFKAVDFYGGEDAFNTRKINDEIKNKFCKNNNITLLRFNELNFSHIETILNNIFKGIN